MLSAPGACPAVAWLRTARVNAAVNAPAIACCAGWVAVTTTTADPSPWVSLRRRPDPGQGVAGEIQAAHPRIAGVHDQQQPPHRRVSEHPLGQVAALDRPAAQVGRAGIGGQQDVLEPGIADRQDLPVPGQVHHDVVIGLPVRSGAEIPQRILDLPARSDPAPSPAHADTPAPR